MLANDIRKFYNEHYSTILNNKNLVKLLEATPIGKRNVDKEDRFRKTFNAYLEEAVVTASLLDEMKITKSDKLLEVGGGVGMTYIFLYHNGYNIFSIEPSDSGFEDYFSIGKEFCKTCGVSDDKWFPLLGENTTELNEKFDFIFSNNVLEHVPTIDETFDSLKMILKPNGRMIHNTVNYIIPYEPHFGILLFPIFPQLTTIFKPKLKKSAMWNGLNFITTRKIRKISKRLKFDVEFDNKAVYRTFQRISQDTQFAQRQKIFIPIVKLFEKLGILNSLKYLPTFLNTPMKFTLKHKNS